MPNEYTSAYAPMQSNAQYTQPQIMGLGQQEAMHNAMLAQQQQYNNQSANIAGQPSGLSRALAPMQQMMMARALRQGMDQNSPYGGTPQGGYAQQGQYMQDATNNPATQQQMGLYNQGGPEFMSFNNPMPSGS
jgi:hypothetical protein